MTDDLDARFASRIDSLKQDIRFLIIYAYPIGDSTFLRQTSTDGLKLMTSKYRALRMLHATIRRGEC